MYNSHHKIHTKIVRSLYKTLYRAVLDDHGSLDPFDAVDLNHPGSISIDFEKVKVDLGLGPNVSRVLSKRPQKGHHQQNHVLHLSIVDVRKSEFRTTLWNERRNL